MAGETRRYRARWVVCVRVQRGARLFSFARLTPVPHGMPDTRWRGRDIGNVPVAAYPVIYLNLC